MRRALVAAVVVLAAGCFPSGTREPQRFYILDAPEPQTGPARVPRAAALAVPPTSSASFYDNQDLVYSRAPGTRAYYQFNSWTERPGRAIHEALVARLARSGLFKTIVGSDTPVADGAVLRTHLEEIYHDAVKPPGTARVVLSAELQDGRGAVIARRSFSRSAPAPSYDAAGAVQGFRQALAGLLDELVLWVDENAPR
jgi:cholesterol transport system auxiliary component